MDNGTALLASQPLNDAVKAILNAAPRQWLLYALGLLLGYPILTSCLRYRRLRNLHTKYPYATREDMAKMTDDHAFEIQKTVAQLEFPFMFIKALQFALFRVRCSHTHTPPIYTRTINHFSIFLYLFKPPKLTHTTQTYGIPSISHLLVKTSQFSNASTSLKRYTDTSALVQEMVGNNPSSPRAHASFARTRFLHAGYRASGKILEDDMLFTLSLFALQPIRFIDRFEWRRLSDLERCAIGTFWKSAGDALGISYEKLPSGGGAGFKDGIQWLEEMNAWSEKYEAEKMVPDAKNRETADQTTAVLLYMLPKVLHPVGLQFVSFMMDERLRRAMLYVGRHHYSPMFVLANARKLMGSL